MGSVNRVLLVGRLGKDAETRVTQNGAAVCNFSLATSDRYKDKSGDYTERTEWHRIVLFGKAAESLSNFLVKGKEIAIEGRIQTRSYEKDGQKHYSTEIVAERVQLLGSKPRGSEAESVEDSEVPF